MFKKGYKMSEEHKKRIAESNRGRFLSDKTKQKISKSKMGTVMSKETREKISNYMKGKKHANHKLTVERILKECEELKKQGFRVVPTGWKVIPDIIAIKNNKIYAVEVEYGRPNYSKYTTEVTKMYDDIIWILRKPKETS